MLVVNNTLDTTAAIVRSLAESLAVPLEVIEHTFPPELASAGSARRMAMDCALELAGAAGAVLTTDADGPVPLDWVAANLFYLRQGIDAVAGRAVLDRADEAMIPGRLREDDALECAYATALDEIVSVLHPPKAPEDIADQEQVNEYEAVGAEAGTDPRAEALLAEIERRDLDL